MTSARTWAKEEERIGGKTPGRTPAKERIGARTVAKKAKAMERQGCWACVRTLSINKTKEMYGNW